MTERAALVLCLTSADGAPALQACSAEDSDAWRSAHLQPGLVALGKSCYVSCGKLFAGCYECAERSACTAAYVYEASAVAECSTCTNAEAACTARLCHHACRNSGTDTMCLGCLCEAGCLSAFEQCAGTQLNLCTPLLYGRDASAEDYVLSTPIFLRSKRETGGVRGVSLVPDAPATWPTSSQIQLSEGYAHLVSFALEGREYVVHAKSQSQDEPCISRIWPVLSDGSFGRPVYEDVWTRGFDQVETFVVDGKVYLLRYKSGLVETGGDVSRAFRGHTPTGQGHALPRSAS